MYNKKIRMWDGKKLAIPSSYKFSMKNDMCKIFVDGYFQKKYSVMSFSGGTAYNGDIYEYDIIADIKTKENYLVVFNDFYNCFTAVNKNSNFIIISEMLNYKVIGNIFETKDFLFKLRLMDIDDLISDKIKKILMLDTVKPESSIVESKDEIESIDFDQDLFESSDKISKNNEKLQQDDKKYILENKTETSQTSEVSDNGIKSNNVSDNNYEDDLIFNSPDFAENIDSEIFNLDLDYIPDTSLSDDCSQEPDMQKSPEQQQKDFNRDMLALKRDLILYGDYTSVVEIYYNVAYNKENRTGIVAYSINSENDFHNYTYAVDDVSCLNELNVLAASKILRENFYLGDSIKLYTSSLFLITPFNEGWLEQWKNNNWHNTATNNIINYKDSWDTLYEISLSSLIIFTLVNNKNNENEEAYNKLKELKRLATKSLKK